MSQALQRRASAGLGVSGASVKQLDTTHFQVDLPGYSDQQAGGAALGQRGVFQLIDTGNTPLNTGATVSANAYPVLFTGSQIDPTTVGAGLDPQGGTPYVKFGFAGAAASRFDQYTRSHIGQYLTMTLDGVVIESATIQSEISGVAQVQYGHSLDDAMALAACLKSGPLPAPVTLVSASLAPGGAS
jgi:preprotein translocase subunit SecD